MTEASIANLPAGAGPQGNLSWPAGGERAAIELAIKRDRSHIAAVACDSSLLPAQLAGLHVEVDGTRVPHQVNEDINPRCIVVRIPPRATLPETLTEVAVVMHAGPIPGAGQPVFSISVLPEEPALRAIHSRFALWRRIITLGNRKAPAFPLSHFDGRAYLKANPDVAEAVIAGRTVSGLQHYRRHGLREGRPYFLALGDRPNEGSLAEVFDSAAYLQANPDAEAAVRSGDIPSALDHFLKHGRAEGRKAFIHYPVARTAQRRAPARLRWGRRAGESGSQLGQDLWVAKRSGGKRDGYFVDIGATDGIHINNTYLLESSYGWKGICIEPDPVAFSKLARNRKALCSNACLWSVTGESLEFILASEFGAIAQVAGRDFHAGKRKTFEAAGKTIQVTTTSLNDLLSQQNAPRSIDYISLDTEGSEYEILRTFDFDRWKVALWTIEHNYTSQRARIYELMSAHGYRRVPAKFDDWYFLPTSDSDRAASTEGVVQDDLIYDVGFHVGEDTDFYLRKGFRVVAIEANPRLVEQARERFGSYIASGQLVLLNIGIGEREETLPFYVNKAVSEWSSFDEHIGTTRGEYHVIDVPVANLATIFEQQGIPYYLKIDIEGFDFLGLKSLRALCNRPRFVSVENGQPYMLREMVELGYREFKFINQQGVSEMRLPNPAREGRYVEHRFPAGASGPFGEETIGEWKTAEEILPEIKAYWDNPGRNPHVHGWFDLHAKL